MLPRSPAWIAGPPAFSAASVTSIEVAQDERETLEQEVCAAADQLRANGGLKASG
jgi:hypothetical protein